VFEVINDDRETDEALLLPLRRPSIGEGRRSISDSVSGLFLFLKECSGKSAEAMDLISSKSHSVKTAMGSDHILCPYFDVVLHLR
jgi:hypothetical protein